MKKDTVYSLRMSSRVREALNRAAHKDRRTVSSLLDKIITDYLENAGFLQGPECVEERRRFPRERIPLPAKTLLRVGSQLESFPSVIQDISLGGVMVVYPRGSEIRFASTGRLPHFELRFELPRTDEQLSFQCDARHMRDTGNEIQVGATFSNVQGDDLQKLKEFIM